ncbi:MAG: N-acetylmuramoyl-L-alanine amidase [Candidatus Sumerlaeia bacterium]|nr:N-acetylmuramoyl-L-alanine amidase [Candidatus Sumerlaeia bacterium]
MKRNILVLGLAFLGYALKAEAQTTRKIYIDPGHGGTDAGAVNDTFGTREADRVLFTGLAFRDYLNQDTANTSGGGNWQVRLSRSENLDVELATRATDANSWGADRFLSIHQNAFNDSANGTETFSFSNTGTSFQLSTLVQEEAILAWNRVNRGTKVGNFLV